MFVDQNARAPGEKKENVSYDQEIQRRKRRSYRYKILSLFKKRIIEGKLKYCSVIRCSSGPVPVTRKRKDGSEYLTGSTGEILVKHISGDGSRHGYSNMYRCGASLLCPVCSAIIRYYRLLEILKVIRTMYEKGYTLAHITLTASHDYKTNLGYFKEKFVAAEDQLKTSRSYKAFKKRIGLKHHIRVVEITDDHPDSKQKTGWHFHIHQIVFIKRDLLYKSREAADLQKRLQAEWVKCLQKNGLTGHVAHAAKVQYVDVGDEQDEQQIIKLGEYVAKAMSFELSGLPAKKGKGANNRRVTIWELQKMVLERDDERLYQRYNEYIEGIKGVNWIRFSKGLRDFCGIEKKTDQEIVQQQNSVGEEKYVFQVNEFAKISRLGFQGYILNVGENAIERGIDSRDEIRKFVRLVEDDIDFIETDDYNLVCKSTGEVIA